MNSTLELLKQKIEKVKVIVTETEVNEESNIHQYKLGIGFGLEEALRIIDDIESDKKGDEENVW